MSEDRPLRIKPFEAGTAESRLWFFDIRAANGEIVAQSEGYTSKEARDQTIALLAHGHYVVEEG